MSVKGHNYTVKTEFGKTHSVKLKNCNVAVGEDVHIAFDFTDNEIIHIQTKEVAFPDDEAVHEPTPKEPPSQTDEDEEFLGTQDYE
jgi:hypothetical protein